MINGITNILNFIKVNKVNVLIVEGYEMTGKSRFIKELVKESDGKLYCYRPDYDLYDDKIDRSERYLLGLPVLEVAEYHTDKVLVLDRSFISSLVYNKLSNINNPYTDDSLDRSAIIRDTYLKLIKKLGLNVMVVLCTHENTRMSMVRYEAGLVDGEHVDKYDKFESYDDYYKSYELYTEEYLDIIKSLKDDILISVTREGELIR